MARVRGPFTPSQWIELEHQALIYKYLAANSPVPHSLLIPIRRSLTSPYSPAYFGSSTLGWGSFQLGYSGSADPEPGRCRRTDGKKWRCSRDAVADQKYWAPAAASANQPSTPAAHGGGAASGLAVNHHQQQMKNYTANTANPCSLQYSRELVNKHSESEQGQDSDTLSMLTSMNTRNTSSLFPFSKQQHNPFEVSGSRSEFGLVSPDSLMSSPHSSLENVNLLTSQSLNEHQSSVSLQHFVDWPRTPAQGALAWPDAEDMQAQRSQLSISAPMASSDLSSASTSPIHEKLMLSPLKLCREYSPIGLGAAANRDEVNQGEANWMPMFRDSLMGGPLGEVLTKNNNVEARNCLSASLNLLNDGWDSSSGFDSSPVGVLQKTTFGSVSSSTGSSPRLENHSVYDGITNLRDDLGSIVVNHPSIRLV
uniref:Growth-regulating factor n=1 Tax=Oryza brachyantha TaxID=4533 RepID=J3LSG8_ORYBR